MASDRIGSEDIFKDDLFSSQTESAQKLSEKLTLLSTGLQELLTKQKQILETTKVDSADAIKAINQALKDSATAKKGLATVDKELEKLKQAQLTTDGKVIDVIKKEAAAETALTKAKEAQNRASSQAKINKEQEAIASFNKAKAEVNAQKATIQLTAAQQRQAAQTAKQSAQTAKLNSAYAKSSARLNDLRKRLKDLAISGRTGGKVFKGLQQEVTELDRRLKKADAAAGQFQRNVGNYPTALKGAIRSLKNLGAALGITGGVIALGNAIRNSFNIYKDFQQANANLAAILGVSSEEIKTLRANAIELGSTTVFTASQISQLQTELAKLGFREDDILNSTEAVQSLAAATGTDLAQSAFQVGSALRAFGLETSEAQRVVDVFAKSTSASALNMGFLNTAISSVAPVAATFGFTIEETTALLGKLADAGFDASSAGTATRNILLNLADSSGDLANTLGRVPKNLDELVEGLVELDETGVSLTKTLELTDKRSVAAFNTFIKGARSARSLADELERAGGFAERAAKTQLNTLQGAITKLNSAWEGLILTIVESDGAIANFLRNSVDGITNFINFLSGKGLKDVRSGFEDASRAIFDSGKAASQAAEDSKELIKTFNELNEVTDRNQEQQDELFKTTLLLKDALGQSVVAVDEETGALKLNEKEVEKQIAIKEELAIKENLILEQRLKGVQGDQDATDKQIRLVQKEIKVRREQLIELGFISEASQRLQGVKSSLIAQGELSTRQLTKDNIVIKENDALIVKRVKLGDQEVTVFNALGKARKALTGEVIRQTLQNQKLTDSEVNNRKATKAQLEKEEEFISLTLKLNQLQADKNDLFLSQADLKAKIDKDLLKGISADKIRLALAKEGNGATGEEIGLLQSLKSRLEEETKARDKLLKIKNSDKLSTQGLINLSSGLSDENKELFNSINDTIDILGKEIAILEGAKNAVDDLAFSYESLGDILEDIEQEDFRGAIDKISDAVDDATDGVLDDLDLGVDVSDEEVKKVKDTINELFELRKDAINSQALSDIEERKLRQNEIELLGKDATDAEIEEAKRLSNEIILIEKKRINDIAALNRDQVKTLNDFDDDVADGRKKNRDKDVKEDKEALDEKRQNYIDFIQDVIKLTKEQVKAQNELLEKAQGDETKRREIEIDRQSKLAAEGLDNQLAFSKERLAKSQQQEFKLKQEAAEDEKVLRLTSVYFKALESRFSEAAANEEAGKKGGVNSETAPLFALKDTFLAGALANTLAGAFATGVEDFQGKGTGTSDSNLIAFSHGESVVTAKGTKENKGLTTAMNSGMVSEYFKNNWLPKFQLDNAVGDVIIIDKNKDKDNSSRALLGEIQNLNSIMSDRPIQQVAVDQFGNLIETVYKNGVKSVYKHKTNRSRL